MYLGTVYVSIKFRPDQTSYGCHVAILEHHLRAIDMQLCTYVPLGNTSRNSQT
jgi:hypothetical protein